jgi:hypothetical protein
MRWNATTGAWVAVDSKLNKQRALTAFALGPVPGGADVLYVAGAFGTATSFAVYRSANQGRSWTAVTPAASASGTAAAIRYLAVAATDPNVVYAGTETALYVSGRGGATWTPTGPASTGATAITALAVDPASSQTAYVATVAINQQASSAAAAFKSATVWRTVDGGGHWTAIRHYGPSILILQVVAGVHVLLVGAQLAGNQVNSVLDESNAGSWRSLEQGLPHNVLGAVAATDGTRLYLGTSQEGVWTRGLSGGGAPSGTGGGSKGGAPTPTPVIPGGASQPR